MLALERVACLFVIERFDIPFDQREVFAIMLGVAAGALLTGTRRDIVGRMKAASRGKTRRDLRVTFQALQRSLSAKFVATGAIRGSVQGLVWTGKLPGRDLRGSWGMQQDDGEKQA